MAGLIIDSIRDDLVIHQRGLLERRADKVAQSPLSTSDAKQTHLIFFLPSEWAMTKRNNRWLWMISIGSVILRELSVTHLSTVNMLSNVEMGCSLSPSQPHILWRSSSETFFFQVHIMSGPKPMPYCTKFVKWLALNIVLNTTSPSQIQACPKPAGEKEKKRETFDRERPNKSVEQRA